MRSETTPQKTALVLCGGGILGAMEVGFYKALVELGVKIDLVVGTSIGALNGALIAAGVEPEALARLWRQARMRDFFTFDWSLLWRGWRAESLFSNRRFRRYLETHLPVRRFERLGRPLIITATDVETGLTVELGPAEGDLVSAVLASAALPGLFPPVRIDGRDSIDGGVSANCALDVALAHGATTILAMECRCGSKGTPRTRGFLARIRHAFGLALEAKYRADVDRYSDRASLILVPPNVAEGVRCSDLRDAGKLIEAAYQAAKAQLEVNSAGSAIRRPIFRRPADSSVLKGMRQGCEL
ncbi:MAG: patatin-like phospholipase family protein [Verrucomicrobia subdivision 3 bacterium]|nr:patatin-like phospholipase family protein [Limisphaerales bacterium]